MANDKVKPVAVTDTSVTPNAGMLEIAKLARSAKEAAVRLAEEADIYRRGISLSVDRNGARPKAGTFAPLNGSNCDAPGQSVETLPDGRITKITFKGGKSISVSYTSDKEISKVVLPDGMKWQRDTGANDWVSSDNQHRKMTVSVYYSGVVMTESNGITRNVGHDGVETKSFPSLDASDFRRLFLKNLPLLDPENKNEVSSGSIDRAVGNKSFTGQDAELIVVLKENQDRLKQEHQSWFSFLGGDDSVTTADVEKFDRQFRVKQKQLVDVEDYSTMFSVNEKKFAAINASGNKDGISKDDIKKAIASGSFTSEEQTALLPLLDDFDEINDRGLNIFKDRISISEIAAYAKKIQEDPDIELATEINQTSWVAQQRLGAISYSLFANEKEPIKSVVPSAVQQGVVGDCYFLGVLGSLAAIAPEKIVRMIHDNKDGTYSVTFPGDTRHPVTAPAPTETELALYAAGSKYGTWAPLLEKAYGEYRLETGTFGREHPLKSVPTVPAEAADFGDNPLVTERLLTDGTAQSEAMKSIETQRLIAVITSSEHRKRPLSVSTNDDDVRLTKQGLLKNHVYSILGYDPRTGRVMLRDPHGDQGRFTLSLEELKLNFQFIDY